MLDENQILTKLKDQRIITVGHFKLRSKLHSDKYVDKIVDPQLRSELGYALAYQARQMVSDIHTVIAPAVGGVALADNVARHLADLLGCEVMTIFAEKEKTVIADPKGIGRVCYAETGAFTIQDSWHNLIAGKNLMVVDDTVTSGGSIRKVVEAVRGRQGKVMVVGVICNRGQVTSAEVGNPPHLLSLVNLPVKAWTAETCPLCKKGIPFNASVGSGRGFAVNQ